MKSARGGPGVSVIDFNHVKDFTSDCISGELLKLKHIKSNNISIDILKELLEMPADRRLPHRICILTGAASMDVTLISSQESRSGRKCPRHPVRMTSGPCVRPSS